MERRKLSGIVTRKSEVAGKPDHLVRLTCGEVWVFRKMQEAGHGYDWEWETDAFSHHKRWWLTEGQTFEDTSPKRTKPPTGATVAASNPNTSNAELGGVQDAS